MSSGMNQPKLSSYDVVIVGAGVSCAMIAKQLGLAGKKVLILEAGAAIPPNNVDFMQRFYTTVAKVPESPYTPDLFNPPGSSTLTDPSTLNAGRPTVLTLSQKTWQNPNLSYLTQDGPLAFGSTYERIAGGTMRHWLGTSLRFVPNDFCVDRQYHQEVDWPISYDDLSSWYGKAEHEIGVSADIGEQEYLGVTFPPGYSYPMPKIPMSLVDQAVSSAVDGMQFFGIPVNVTSTPAGRNSQPYQNRRVCAGNTNCIPICPIQAKYDPSVTLNQALDTGNVEILSQTVANEVVIDANGRVSQINYIQYKGQSGPKTGSGSISGKVYVIASNAIETPRLLLLSDNQGRLKNGVANSSLLVGKNLMDHPLYLAWALMPKPVFGYRGPLSTSGIENLRDGAFRSQHAPFRIEIGNEGWNFPIGDPDTTTVDFINGLNLSGLNTAGSGGSPQALSGQALVNALNDKLTRQFRLGFLVEQSPETSNCVSLSSQTDHLGLRRPSIKYDLSPYTKAGMAAAKQTADAIFDKLKAVQFTAPADPTDPSTFMVDINGKPTRLKFFGSGHIVGTYRMGTTKENSVVNREQRSWDHPNLFLVGSGVFPTVATANPTLTIAALALWAADTILRKDLSS
ncbi:MAG TPA: GMC family oxidoreductase [Blastocatellia bacterium]|nr:GMC family oxidoreductase [Blastocatellia bacterium]